MLLEVVSYSCESSKWLVSVRNGIFKWVVAILGQGKKLSGIFQYGGTARSDFPLKKKKKKYGLKTLDVA